MTSPRVARTTALTSAGAAAALRAAQEEALAIGVPVTIAVFDGGGAIKSLSRTDGAENRRIAAHAATAALAGSSTPGPRNRLPG